MTAAMLTEQLALPQQSAHSVTDPISLLAEENRLQTVQRLENAEPGNFVTYSNNCVGRPGMKDFWYSQEHGWQDPESSAVPICFKDSDGQAVFGLFAVTGIERPERPVQPLAGDPQPPRCWFVKGSFIMQNGERLNVRGKFTPDTFSGEVVLSHNL